MNTDTKREGGEKKTLKMEEETLVGSGIVLVWTVLSKTTKGKNTRRKE